MVTEGAWCWLWKVFSNSGSRFFSSEVKNLFWIPHPNKPLPPGNDVQLEEGRTQARFRTTYNYVRCETPPCQVNTADRSWN